MSSIDWFKKNVFESYFDRKHSSNMEEKHIEYETKRLKKK